MAVVWQTSNPYVDVVGNNFASQPQSVRDQYVQRSAGDPALAARLWAQDSNSLLIGWGLAINTPDGLMSVDAIKRALGIGPGYTGPTDPQSLAAAYAAQRQPTRPVTNNCALCATGQSSACAGCAPATPPGFVSTGTGTPISLTSGLPLGFRPTSPVSIAGIRLPMWAWIGGGLGAWMVLRPGGRRRFF